MTSFFIEVDGFFVGRDPARGPWSVDHCHAGPVTGMIARAAERAAGPEKPLARLTVDLVRPVPMSGFRVEATPGRAGRTLATASLVVLDRAGETVATATSLHLAERDLGPIPTAPVERLSLAEARPDRFPFREVGHDQPCFGDQIEVAFPPGETPDPGPTTIWMRTPPLLSGETPSSFQRLCPLADCGNATSRNAEMDEIGFVNADLTIAAYRTSGSEWLASTARSEWSATAVGLSTAIIQDEDGPVAVALQCLALRRAAG